MKDTPSRLSTLLEQAESDLQAATGGAPLCRPSSTSTRQQSIKYFEGRWAALREVARGDDADQALSRWQESYRTHQDRGSATDWVQYAAGGVDALTELSE